MMISLVASCLSISRSSDLQAKKSPRAAAATAAAPLIAVLEAALGFCVFCAEAPLPEAEAEPLGPELGPAEAVDAPGGTAVVAG
jgi:hypothetical protein